MSDYLQHRRNHILGGRKTPEKKQYSLKPVSDKKKEKLKKEKEEQGESGLDNFFEAMRPKMKNKCLFCGGSTMKNDDEKYRFSIAHLLPKRPVNKGGFPSVATNKDNWIELCYYNNSCHTNFDNGKISWEFIRDSKEWDIVKEKLLIVLPLVSEEERKHKLYSKLIELVYRK